jgi:tRNA threonylcarbamoyladenosine biosynthesis protein TsaE
METLEFADREQARKWATLYVNFFRRPCVVLLSGALGAGKTQLVKWFLQELKVNDVVSPTFAVHQQYVLGTQVIDHVDLFRLKSDADLESSGFWDLLAQSDGLVFVEWADRLPDSVWPRHWTKIFIAITPGKSESSEARSVQLRIVKPG